MKKPLILLALLVTVWLAYRYFTIDPNEKAAYDAAIQTMSLASFKSYLNQYPRGRYKNALYQRVQQWCTETSYASCIKEIGTVLNHDHELIKILKQQEEKL